MTMNKLMMKDSSMKINKIIKIKTKFIKIKNICIKKKMSLIQINQLQKQQKNNSTIFSSKNLHKLKKNFLVNYVNK